VLVKGPSNLLQMSRYKDKFMGLQQSSLGFEGLMMIQSYDDHPFGNQVTVEKPSLDDILVFTQEGQ